jgi:hypothetical protein
MVKLGIPMQSIANNLPPAVDDPSLRLHDSRYITDKIWQNTKHTSGITDSRHIYYAHN